MEKMECKICGNYGFYQNLNGEWIFCPRCQLMADYKRLIKNEKM